MQEIIDALRRDALAVLPCKTDEEDQWKVGYDAAMYEAEMIVKEYAPEPPYAVLSEDQIAGLYAHCQKMGETDAQYAQRLANEREARIERFAA